METEKLILIQKAKDFATVKHAGQMYGEHPYTFHLDAVVEVLQRFKVVNSALICAGYLHDTIEDTGTKYLEIKNNFNEQIAEIVFDVTDELGRTREDIKEKTFVKTAAHGNAIVVKLADRIANVEASIAQNNTKKFEMYKKEFKRMAHALHLDLWPEPNHRQTEDLRLEMFKHLAILVGYSVWFAEMCNDNT